jgi:hypothetical protein
VDGNTCGQPPCCSVQSIFRVASSCIGALWVQQTPALASSNPHELQSWCCTCICKITPSPIHHEHLIDTVAFPALQMVTPYQSHLQSPSPPSKLLITMAAPSAAVLLTALPQLHPSHRTSSCLSATTQTVRSPHHASHLTMTEAGQKALSHQPTP